MTYKKIGGMAFVACMFVGMGISFMTNTMPAGLFIGMGVGFAFQALIHFIGKEREEEFRIREMQYRDRVHMEGDQPEPFEPEDYREKDE